MVPQHPPLVRRSAAEQARIETGMIQFFENIPFHQHLGFKIDSFTADSARIGLLLKPEIIGNVLHHRLHGGVIATVLDAAGGFAISMGMAEKHCDETAEQLSARFSRIGTIDLRVDYLRQGQGKRFVAAARVLRLGGRIASTQMTLENDAGELIATGAAAYVVS
jgi:uncharacterized protein (TIGR00369 family)